MARTGMRYKRILLGAGVLMGALLVSPVTAHVGDSVSHLWLDHLQEKTDARYVRQADSIWARVDGEGTLINGDGVTNSGKDGTGTYFVSLKRNAQNCAAVATPRSNGLISSTDQYGLNPKALEIAFVNTANNPVDTGFSIIVRC